MLSAVILGGVCHLKPIKMTAEERLQVMKILPEHRKWDKTRGVWIVKKFTNYSGIAAISAAMDDAKRQTSFLEQV